MTRETIAKYIGVILLGMRHAFLTRLLSFLISFAVGGLIGDTFIHILPEMAEDGAFFPKASLIIAIGILFSFLLEKIIHWRHSHSLEQPDHNHPHPLGLISLIGDAAHNLVDGFLIAGSYLVDVPTGIATTIAVVLHEIPQELSDYAILIHSGYSKGKATLLNALTALTAIVGALLVLVLQASMPNIERYLLPLVAGNFLYIAVADLLPELQKQTRVSNTIAQLLGVFAGIILMFLLTFLE